MNWLGTFLRRQAQARVRPWGLAVPIAVLIVSLPLLRPLRIPDPTRLGDSEAARLATVDAIVENPVVSGQAPAMRLAIRDEWSADVTTAMVIHGRRYSVQAPMLAFILAGPYAIMHHLGWTLRDNSVFVPFMLTLIGSTLPVAAAAGLLYRIGRLFELRRNWRTLLAAICVFGGGLISYATVINPHAPAAALIIAAAGCLIQVAASERPGRQGGWLVGAGLLAALAGTIDPLTALFAVLFPAVIFAMRLPTGLKIAGVLLYGVGMMPPMALYAVLTMPLTGDLRPGVLHPELVRSIPRSALLTTRSTTAAASPTAESSASVAAQPLAAPDDEEVVATPGLVWRSIAAAGSGVADLLATLLGSHGLLSHFPIAIVGAMGIGAVMHRHWPMTTKLLAAISATGMIAALVLCMVHDAGPGAMFANQTWIAMMPMLLFWIGAWFRRRHRRGVWIGLGILLGFSVIVSLIGATDPMPRNGYDQYTPIGAIGRMVHGEATSIGQ